MLSLTTKQSEKLDLYPLLRKNVEETCGPQIWAPIDIPVRHFQELRDSLLQIAMFRNDMASMENLIGSAKTYISMWNSISQSFTFGKERVLNVLS